MRDVVLVTSDSMRAKSMSVYGYGRETTPYLDELASESITFTNAHSVGPSSASMSGTMTSTVPLTRGAYFSIPSDLPTIAESLPADYTSIAVHAHGLFVGETGFDAGFDEFVQLEREHSSPANAKASLKSAAKSALRRSDRLFSAVQSAYRTLKRNVMDPRDPRVDGDRVFARVREIVSEIESPVFLWIHLMDTHSPFVPEEDILAQFAPQMTMQDVTDSVVYRNENEAVDPTSERTQSLIDAYDAEIRRTDSLLESFIEGTKRDSTFENPVYIVSADHGEAFGEHDWLGHPPEALYDETLWIPLIVHDPTTEEFRRDDTVVSSLDLGPTICELAGTDPPPSFRGQSLLAATGLERDGVFSLASHESRWVLDPDELGVRYRTADWAFLYRASAADELYRVGQSENVLESYPEVADRLRAKVDELVANVSYPDEETLQVSEKNKEHLRDLGYVVD